MISFIAPGGKNSLNVLIAFKAAVDGGLLVQELILDSKITIVL